MSQLTHHRTSNPYESLFKYSRAVKKGPFIFVSGTTAVSLPEPSSDPQDTTHPPSTDHEAPEILHPTSAYLQSQHIFTEIAKAVRALGGDPATDIVRVRMYVTHEEDGGKVGKALKESGFGVGETGEGGGPAATMILGVKFVHPDMRVEIEADAVVL
ncbi:hypothetical protein D9611_011671 [Ephemerocybe angulata]|uniref:YjgF-like protein n=1 Tax=Ephemerocybe angulata TaxID=980116 RepID=A0A8H5C4Z0_9AGAR|nr:hypothetical protein D9611_011671 [Tulosesus angulatus]